ncbi:hypothetical protein XENOCAPTIV_003984 [Xenoophorus captivus]|uniref:Uncharacterized protein n=1 Tax=Xenoophorus captivus TaxID=1517983 RepID=A0ABV0QUS0_9TELE
MALLDYGCEPNLIDQALVTQLRLGTEQLPSPRQVLALDGQAQNHSLDQTTRISLVWKSQRTHFLTCFSGLSKRSGPGVPLVAGPQPPPKLLKQALLSFRNHRLPGQLLVLTRPLPGGYPASDQ